MGWGEEQNRMNAETEIINYIIGYQVSVEDVAQLLDYIMEEKFSTLLEDGSSTEIASILMTVYEESLQGKQDQLNKLKTLSGCDTELSKKTKTQEGIISSLENLEINPPSLVPMVDDEGFETVVSKKHKKK